MSRKKIVVYADGLATIHDLCHSLRETFAGQDIDIVPVTRQDFFGSHDLFDDSTLCFALPGTPGGSSAYREQLGPDGFARIDGYVRRGGCYLGICAGGYLATREFEYEYKDSGELRQVSSPLPFFEGRAVGPIHDLVDMRETKNPWANYSVARVAFTNAAGEADEGWACYSCGPAFFIDEDKNDSHAILARYSDVAGAPAAVVSRRIGRGRAIGSSLVAEIGGERMFQQINPKSQWYEHALDFVNRLFDKEQSRQRIWDMLVHEILENARQNGRYEPSLPGPSTTVKACVP